MGMHVCHHPDEDRLDLTVEGRLDLTLASEILEASRFVDERLLTCVIDCTRVERVFDSGVALLMLLVRKLARYKARLVLIGEIPGLARESLPPGTVAQAPLVLAAGGVIADPGQV